MISIIAHSVADVRWGSRSGGLDKFIGEICTRRSPHPDIKGRSALDSTSKVAKGSLQGAAGASEVLSKKSLIITIFASWQTIRAIIFSL